MAFEILTTRMCDFINRSRLSNDQTATVILGTALIWSNVFLLAIKRNSGSDSDHKPWIR